MRTLADYKLLSEVVLGILARSTRFECQPELGSIIATHPRLIIVMNHSTPLSWLPGPLLLTLEACARGGGRRVPFAVMDRFFYSHPVLLPIAKLVSQTTTALTYDSLVEIFSCPAHSAAANSVTDLVIFPEGSNCFFTETGQIGPLRSDKFLQLAAETQTAILVCAHRGSEAWAQELNLREPIIARLIERLQSIAVLPQAVRKFLFPRLTENQRFLFPLLPKTIDCFEMRVQLVDAPRDGSQEEISKTREQVLAAMSAFSPHGSKPKFTPS